MFKNICAGRRYVGMIWLLLSGFLMHGFCSGAATPAEDAARLEKKLCALAMEGELSGDLVSSFYQYAWANARAKIQAPDEFWYWLSRHPEMMGNLLIGLAPNYNSNVVKCLQQLRETFGAEVEQYPHLALAFSFVYGAAKNGNVRSGWLRWTAKNRPVPSCVDSFAYYLENKDKMFYPLGQFPWPLLVYVADNDIPLSERQWVLNRYRKVSTKTFGRLHTAPPYVKGTSAHSLPAIRKEGGTCHKQAYYASRVIKSLGVPSFEIHAPDHIYEGWVIEDQRFKTMIGSAYGRHNGAFLCPLTRKVLHQYQFNMLVSSINHSYDKYLSSKIACYVFDMLDDESKKQAIGLLEASMKNNPYVVDAWLIHAQACEDGIFPIEEGFTLFDRASGVIDAHPELRCTILNKLTAAQLKSKDDISINHCVKTVKRFQDTLDWLIKKKRVDLAIGVFVNHASYLARTKGVDVAVDHSLEWFKLSGFSLDNEKRLFAHVRSIAAKSKDKGPLEKLLSTEYARRRRYMLTCSEELYPQHYSCYAQAAKANIDYYKKAGQNEKASELYIELDRFKKENLNLDDLPAVVTRGLPLGAAGQQVTKIVHAQGCHVWRILYSLPKGLVIRVRSRHAASGKKGAFCFTAWSDTDNNGMPDTQIGMSPLMTAEKDQWSEWEFTSTERTVFVGYITKTKTPIYYQMGGLLDGYNGLSDQVFYTRKFDGTPEQTVQPRYSNLRVEILRD